ncbi:MAG: hypothetical protein WCW40_00725 [Bacteroidota bacterium]
MNKIRNIFGPSEEYKEKYAIAVRRENYYLTALKNQRKNGMAKSKEEQPLQIKCPNCKQTREPDFNETTKRYVCSVCNEPVDVQVIIEKKKRGLK